jgi:hypothetical protein
MDHERRLDWLVELERLRQLPQRYARAVDERNPASLAELFHPDGTVTGTAGTTTVADYLAGVGTRHPAFVSSQHVLGVPVIDLSLETGTARMDTYGVVYQLERVAEPHDDLVLGVRYLDELVRHDDGWRIANRTTQILWARTVPSASDAAVRRLRLQDAPDETRG